MGSLHAMEYADLLSLEDGIRVHLTSNHYPPVPVSMVPVCIKAIRFAQRGKWDSNLTLPDGIEFKGSKTAPVSSIVESHHLDAWLEEVAYEI
jgi:hypothetical protein